MPHACLESVGPWTSRTQKTAEESRDWRLRHTRHTTQAPPGNELSSEVNDCAWRMILTLRDAGIENSPSPQPWAMSIQSLRLTAVQPLRSPSLELQPGMYS